MQLSQTLSQLGFDQAETDLYLFLLKNGSFPVGRLAKRLGVARSTLYTMLSRLSEKGLLRETSKKGLKTYFAEGPDSISKLLSRRAHEIDQAQKSFAEILPALRAQHVAIANTPRLQLHEGKQGLQNILSDMLLYSDLETCAVWPIRSMFEVLGADFFLLHNKERIKRNIYTRAVWPHDQTVKIELNPFMGSGPEFKREIRIAPENISYKLGYWIYADKIAFLSSSEEGYGFILQSRELVETLLVQFELLWEQSIAVSFNRKSVKTFLDSL